MLQALESAPAAPPVRDPHRFINELKTDAIERIVDRLESRGKDAVFARLLENYASKLDLSGSPRVLEIGCGTGVVTRFLAQSPGFAGQVVGADQSAALLNRAKTLAAQAGLSKRVEYDVEDAHNLSYEDASFDIAIAHTLISHVTDPRQVLSEMARVVRPGGTVVVFDGDYASLTYACTDESLGKKMDHALAAATFNNRIIMRTLPQLLTDVGLRLDESIAELVSEIGDGSFFRSFAETYAPNVKTAGLLTDAEVDKWMAEQKSAMLDGTFFAACSYYSYVAHRES
jgi:ubiquinone/menaquinone biosynthesis C-methylase UbiE